MPNKKYNVIISDTAFQMLAIHVSFLAKVNLTSSKKLKSIMIKAIRDLSETAEMYPWLSDPMLPLYKYHKRLVAKRYCIIYQIQNDVVYVEYILDCRRDYNWLI